MSRSEPVLIDNGLLVIYTSSTKKLEMHWVKIRSLIHLCSSFLIGGFWQGGSVGGLVEQALVFEGDPFSEVAIGRNRVLVITRGGRRRKRELHETSQYLTVSPGICSRTLRLRRA